MAKGLIVFDVDGTLADSQFAILYALRESCKSLSIPYPLEAIIRPVIGLALPDMMKHLFPHHDQKTNQRIEEGFFDFYTKAIRDNPEPLFPNAKDCLHDRLEEGWTLAIATGKSRKSLDRFLERHDISHYFSTCQTSDHHPSKPHPSMLQQAMDETGFSSQETLMIGDTLYDCLMAQSINVRAIAVAWGNHEAQDLLKQGAFACLYDFKDLPKILSQITEIVCQ